ncbi:serine-tRNA(Ala) deacylase AlaX [Halalkalibacter akibai]|uniref:Alanyl-tRNA synthetase family protein n=1 Tax=Halalkalibacter akibai (strain ATCC 43226 / DSM 21942 / CIP 109018 / JCM 9157 / 1139) TaxID=1236973 RepID=W4QQC0_HALA3|nr:serine-tRNA(Ala) deacylase AlaX [Halalkalibacter akibai]GAE34305.1 alanyl-tRNA synthetase family protein [Halalkalibacter akibai JCM 9157]
MTKKLYYEDPYIKTFSAIILKQEQTNEGNWFVILNQTAFYPTGGGQPYDTGTLAGVHVVDVQQEEGIIRHFLKSRIDVDDHTEVEGVINWSRRFDHMQQHAGQHLLSAAFADLFDYETVSFHLGKETLTIDLETKQLTQVEVTQAEEWVNEKILKNISIEPKWVNLEEALSYSLRKQPVVKEDIRLVIIPNVDYNACGGTHPSSTGQIRAVKILSWEQQKNRIRVHFICGDRVISLFERKHTVLQELVSLTSSSESNLPNAVRKLIQKDKELEKQVELWNDKLLTYEAKKMLENKMIFKFFKNRPVKELQKLAQMIVTECKDACVVLVVENDNRIQFVASKGDGLQVEVKKVVLDALPLINGKGGGTDKLIQGGGETKMTGKAFLEYLEKEVRKAYN